MGNEGGKREGEVNKEENFNDGEPSTFPKLDLSVYFSHSHPSLPLSPRILPLLPPQKLSMKKRDKEKYKSGVGDGANIRNKRVG